MTNYKKLVCKSKEAPGFIKTFAETCRPSDNDIAALNTKAEEINKISTLASGEKRSVFYKDIKCDVDVFDFDEINSSNGLLSVDAFMINDKDETYLMIECKERSVVLINKYGKYIERYKQPDFSFRVIYDEGEIIDRVKKMDEKINGK